MRELYPALLLGASTRVEMSVGSCGIRIADVCVFSCASRSQASPMLILRRFQKNGEVQIFRKTPFRVFAYHVGLAVTTFSVAHVGVPGVLIRYVAFATITMWAGLPEPRDCGVLSIVLCVSGLENLFPGGAPLFVAHFTLALRCECEDQGRITILSRCCLGSYPRLSGCLHATSCTSAMIGAYALRSSLLLMV